MKDKLERIMKDKLMKDVVSFFFQNQSSVDSASGISAWVCSRRGNVQPVLDELVKLGVLEEDSIGSAKGYCYTRDMKIMNIIEDLMKNGKN
ncbi:MAG: hypothetical protein ABIH85_01775 [Candidatus Omnitrophota bacterium]|nr:hypothetical protein [Candidatus Omnitrophota bacterium]MBU1894792.1 hypothetical protein [Candidatus Omnitrophota bacterium]